MDDVLSKIYEIIDVTKFEGKSKPISDIKQQTLKMSNITSEKISQLAALLRQLPNLKVSEYTQLSHDLALYLCIYYNYCHMVDTTTEDLTTLLTYAPWGDLLRVITKYGNFFRIHQLDSQQLSYICGILLHDVSSEFHTKYHRHNVERLHSLGVEGLIDFCRKIHSNIIYNLIYTNFLDTSVSVEEHMGNTTDSLMVDKINDYFPFDVVYYVDENKKIYGITRTEFRYVLDKKENPWNRSKIPSYILIEIQKRENMSRIYGFNKCEPIAKTWDQLLNPSVKCEYLMTRIKSNIVNTSSSQMPDQENYDCMLDYLTHVAEYTDSIELPMILTEEEREQPQPRSRSSGRRYISRSNVSRSNNPQNMTPVNVANTSNPLAMLLSFVDEIDE